MKLSKHQKEIANKIATGDVFDIYTYLIAFNKGHIEKYDIDKMKQYYHKLENDKTYKVYKDGYSPFEFHSQLMSIRNLSTISNDEWEYVSAELDENISLQKENYNDQTFEFDFVQGVFVADNIHDILDFLAFWEYLSRNALILPISKTIAINDIGVFFNRDVVDPTEVYKLLESRYKTRIEVDSLPSLNLETLNEILMARPKLEITQFSDIVWELNYEHIKMCENYIGQRILPTTDLRLFIKSHYKTREEVVETRTRKLAWLAIGIALISAAFGIIDYFKPQYRSDFRVLENQISEITRILESDANMALNSTDIIYTKNQSSQYESIFFKEIPLLQNNLLEQVIRH